MIWDVTFLSNEGVSNVNHWFDNTIMRNAKKINIKLNNVLKKCIVEDTNKEFHNVDIISIKDSKIPGTNMNTTTGNRKSIYPNTGISNTTHLC